MVIISINPDCSVFKEYQGISHIFLFFSIQIFDYTFLCTFQDKLYKTFQFRLPLDLVRRTYVCEAQQSLLTPNHNLDNLQLLFFYFNIMLLFCKSYDRGF